MGCLWIALFYRDRGLCGRLCAFSVLHPQDDTARTTLTCCWYGTRPPARSWVGPRNTLWWQQPLRGRRRQEPAVTTHPTHPPPPAGGATTGVGRQAVQQAQAPHARRMAVAWSTHAPSTVQPRPPVPRHTWDITFTDASRLCQPPRASRRIVHAVWRSPASTSTVAPRVTLIDPGRGRRRHRQPRGAGSAPRGHPGIAPDAAHHRNRLLVCALSNTQGRAPPAGPHAPPRGDTGRIDCCARGGTGYGTTSSSRSGRTVAAPGRDGRPGRKGGSKEHR
jgi:hypothetical protein